MIAYKVFKLEDGKLYPFWVYDEFEHYPLNYTHVRANGCGPFSCFAERYQAKMFYDEWLYRDVTLEIRVVEIMPSLDYGMWVSGRTNHCKKSAPCTPTIWDGIIYADEFEILERVK